MSSSLLTRKNIIQTFFLGILIIGIPIAVTLVNQTQIFRSRADNPVVAVLKEDGSALTEMENYQGNDLPVTRSLRVKVRLTAPSSAAVIQAPSLALVETVYASHPGTPSYEWCGAHGQTFDGSACTTCPGGSEPDVAAQDCTTYYSCQKDCGGGITVWGKQKYYYKKAMDPCVATCPAATPTPFQTQASAQGQTSTYEHAGQQCQRSIVAGSCRNASFPCGGNNCTNEYQLCTATDTCQPGARIDIPDPTFGNGGFGRCICADGQEYRKVCGNSVCDANESAANCPEDCRPRNTDEEAAALVATLTPRASRDVNNLLSPTQSISPTTAARGAAAVNPTHVKVSESLEGLATTDPRIFSSDPFDFTFTNSDPGPKFVFVKFIYPQGTTCPITTNDDCRSVQAVIYRPQQDAASPTPRTGAGTTFPTRAAAGVISPTIAGQTGTGPRITVSLMCGGARPASVVSLIIKNASTGETVFTEQQVQLNVQGVVVTQLPALTTGTTYQVRAKAPISVSKTVSFTAGANQLVNLSLPLGDIAPRGAPDNVINGSDHTELISQWQRIGSVGVLSGDLYTDGRVNVIDRSCLTHNMNARGD